MITLTAITFAESVGSRVQSLKSQCTCGRAGRCLLQSALAQGTSAPFFICSTSSIYSLTKDLGNSSKCKPAQREPQTVYECPFPCVLHARIQPRHMPSASPAAASWPKFCIHITRRHASSYGIYHGPVLLCEDMARAPLSVVPHDSGQRGGHHHLLQRAAAASSAQHMLYALHSWPNQHLMLL